MQPLSPQHHFDRSKAPEPTVFVVDDDQAIRDALSLLLKASGFNVEAFADAGCFLAAGAAQRPGCLLLDVRMPGLNGLDLQTCLKQQGSPIPVIIITGHGDVPMAIRAIRAGALDFIEKPFDGQELLERIREALDRDAILRHRQIKKQAVAARVALLSPREHQVLDAMTVSKHNKTIAKELGIAVSTVEAHRKKVMEKLKAKSLADVIRMLTLFKDD